MSSPNIIPGHMILTNDPETPAFIPNAGLTDQEDRDYFKGTAEQKQFIIDDLNAQIAPWPTYEPTLDEMGLGPKDDYGYVAPVDEPPFFLIGPIASIFEPGRWRISWASGIIRARRPNL